LSFLVHLDDFDEDGYYLSDYCRVSLHADGKPTDVAPVVVGFKPAHAGREAAAQKVDAIQKAEPVPAVIAGVSAAELAALQRDSDAEITAVKAVFGADSLPSTRKLLEALRVKE
jgi:hypothetical protein